MAIQLQQSINILDPYHVDHLSVEEKKIVFQPWSKIANLMQLAIIVINI